MPWFRRGEPAPLVEAGPEDDTGDSPEALRAAIASVVGLVNSSAGRLPLRAVVTARRVTDVLGDIVDTSEVRPLDVYAVLSVKATATDYLPTTLRSFLALDEELLDVPRGTGRTPVESLQEQLDALEESAAAVLDATRQQDVDALLTQGNFLRTKFTGSDLDLS